MKHNNLPEKLIVNGKNIIDKREMANEFNNTFVKIGPKLAEKYNRQNIHWKVLLTPSILN